MKSPLQIAIRMSCLTWCLTSCAAARAPMEPASPPTEATVCGRYCDRMSACEIAPKECERGCARDLRKFRDGFFPSLVGCLDHELSDATCAQRSIAERRQTLSVCFAATLDAFSERDDGGSLRAIVESVCAHEARCHPTDKSEDCAGALQAKLRTRVTAAIFASVRPELARDVASCIAAASCELDAVVDVCSDRSLPR